MATFGKFKPKEKKELNFARMSRLEVKMVPTGIIPLDIILGGGIPCGDLIEISSPSGVGKTTLLLAVVKSYLSKGMKCAYFDVERGVKRPILENFGILDKANTELGADFLVLSPETYDDLELLFDKVVVDDPYDLVIVDSITSVLPSKLKDKRVAEIEIGLEARQMTTFLKKYKPELRNGGTSVVLINQMRTHIDIKRGMAELESAGGQALQFIPDVRLRMQGGQTMKRQEKTPFGVEEVSFGNNAWIWAIKNRNERSGIRLSIPIIFGRGVSNVMVMIDIAKNAGIVSGGGGGHFKINMDGCEPISIRGLAELNKYVRENYESLLSILTEKGLLNIAQGEVE
jgi:protein RecA